MYDDGSIRFGSIFVGKNPDTNYALAKEQISLAFKATRPVRTAQMVWWAKSSGNQGDKAQQLLQTRLKLFMLSFGEQGFINTMCFVGRISEAETMLKAS